MLKYRLHWSVHPKKDEAWYQNEIESKMMTPDEVARELDINYSLSVSGRVFSTFRQDRHIVTKRPPLNPHNHVYRIWDFGKVNCVLYGQIDKYGRRRVLHERVLGKSDSPSNFEEQFRVAMRDSQDLFPEGAFYDICDPAGSFDDHRGNSTEVQELQKRGIFPQYRRIIELPTRERKHRGRKMLIQDLQSTPGGDEAFQIYVSPNNDDGCVILKKAFLGGYTYIKDSNGNITDKIKEAHPYEDVIDCLIYWYLETDGQTDVIDHVEPWDNDDGHVNPYTGY